MSSLIFFFFNDTATTEIYTLSLHDALPIFASSALISLRSGREAPLQFEISTGETLPSMPAALTGPRSEEHTSELQSHLNLVCRLLLEKKKILLSARSVRRKWFLCSAKM